MRHYLNHGSADEPKLRVYLNLDNLADLRPDTLWPELEGDERMVRLRADGFDGVQVTNGEPPSLGVMPFCGLGDHRPSHQQLRKLPGNVSAVSEARRRESDGVTRAWTARFRYSRLKEAASRPYGI